MSSSTQQYTQTLGLMDFKPHLWEKERSAGRILLGKRIYIWMLFKNFRAWRVGLYPSILQGSGPILVLASPSSQPAEKEPRIWDYCWAARSLLKNWNIGEGENRFVGEATLKKRRSPMPKNPKQVGSGRTTSLACEPFQYITPSFFVPSSAKDASYWGWLAQVAILLFCFKLWKHFITVAKNSASARSISIGL